MSTAIASPASAVSDSRAETSVQFISFAVGTDQCGVGIMAARVRDGRVDFPSGSATAEGTMTASIDLDRLIEGEADEEITMMQPPAVRLVTAG
jgi:hypothetical protein